MNPHPGDVQGVLEPDVLPGLAAIDGLVHAVAPGDALAQLRLTQTDVHDVGVLLIEGHGAHRGVVELTLADGHPIGTGILGLPQTARRMTKVEDIAISRMADDGGAPAAVERSDVAPLERLNLGLEVSVLTLCIRCW